MNVPLSTSARWKGSPTSREKLNVRGWKAMKVMSARLLKGRTGDDPKTWTRRIEREGFSTRVALRSWLTERGVPGYAREHRVLF